MSSISEEDESDYDSRPKRKGSKDRGDDSPPSYDLSQARDAGKGGVEGKKKDGDEKEGPKRKPMSTEARIAWSVMLALPLIAGVLLLFLVTCSTETLRKDFSVLKVAVSDSTLKGLFDTVQGVQDDDDEGLASSSAATRRAAAAEAGYLTLGIWGWCVSDVEGDK